MVLGDSWSVVMHLVLVCAWHCLLVWQAGSKQHAANNVYHWVRPKVQ